MGDDVTDSKSTPVASNTSNTFVSIESGYAHTCALTSTGTIECWGNNSDAQIAEPPWVKDVGGTKSFKPLGAIAELNGPTISKVSVGAESLFTAALTDNGSIAIWGKYKSAVYEEHFILNSGVATDVAAGTDHICY